MVEERQTQEFLAKRGDMQGLNIPIPDPSDKTIAATKEAISQLSTLVDAKVGGIQAVIAEQFRAIDRRLTDRDLAYTLASTAQKEAVATALSAVVETSRGGNIRFDLLERRVAALELAVTAATGKVAGAGGVGNASMQVLMAILAAAGAFIAYYVAIHK